MALGNHLRSWTQGSGQFIDQTLHVFHTDPGTWCFAPLISPSAQLTNDLVGLTLTAKLNKDHRQGGYNYSKCQVGQSERSSTEFTKNPFILSFLLTHRLLPPQPSDPYQQGGTPRRAQKQVGCWPATL